MCLNPEMQGAMLRAVPDLRAFAISLCRSRDRADDLVQDTLLRAIDRIETFEQGSNLEAWLFTILRNRFNTEYRRSKWLVQDYDDQHAAMLTVPPGQVGWSVAQDFRTGFVKLSAEQQQALSLIGASGLSYDQAAVIAGCRPGTMKSRVNRARTMLAAHMSGEDGGAACRRSP